MIDLNLISHSLAFAIGAVTGMCIIFGGAWAIGEALNRAEEDEREQLRRDMYENAPEPIRRWNPNVTTVSGDNR